MTTGIPRVGEIAVNTHTGLTKPADEPFDENRHGWRTYHGTDVHAAIVGWGGFNGRDGATSKAMELVSLAEARLGSVLEVFWIERYVALTFGEDHTIGMYISRSMIETRERLVPDQQRENEYWRYTLPEYTRSSRSNAHKSATGHVVCQNCFLHMPAALNNCDACGHLLR